MVNQLQELPQEQCWGVLSFMEIAFMNLLLMTQPVPAALPPYWGFLPKKSGGI